MRHGAKMAERAGTDAKERWKAGGRVHSVLVELATPRAGAADDLSEVIESVEAVGWRLDRVESAVVSTLARPMILLIFRKADGTIIR